MPRPRNPSVPIIPTLGSTVGPAGPAGPPGLQGATGAGNTGTGTSNVAEIMFAAGDFTTNTTTFKRISGRVVDMTLYPPSSGSLTRLAVFKATLESSSLGVITTVRLYDVTHSVLVAGTLLDNSSVSDPTLPNEVSAILSVGGSAGNLRNDVPSQYEVQISMTGGTPSGDRAVCVDARIVITYS